MQSQVGFAASADEVRERCIRRNAAGEARSARTGSHFLEWSFPIRLELVGPDSCDPLLRGKTSRAKKSPTRRLETALKGRPLSFTLVFHPCLGRNAPIELKFSRTLQQWDYCRLPVCGRLRIARLERARRSVGGRSMPSRASRPHDTGSCNSSHRNSRGAPEDRREDPLGRDRPSGREGRAGLHNHRNPPMVRPMQRRSAAEENA